MVRILRGVVVGPRDLERIERPQIVQVKAIVVAAENSLYTHTLFEVFVGLSFLDIIFPWAI